MGSSGTSLHPACYRSSVDPLACQKICSNDRTCKGFYYYTPSRYCIVAMSNYPNCPSGYSTYSSGTSGAIVQIGNCRSGSSYSACLVKNGKKIVNINKVEFKRKDLNYLKQYFTFNTTYFKMRHFLFFYNISIRTYHTYHDNNNNSAYHDGGNSR